MNKIKREKYFVFGLMLIMLFVFVPSIALGQFSPEIQYDPITGGDAGVEDPLPLPMGAETEPTDIGDTGKSPSDTGDTGSSEIFKNPIEFNSFSGLVVGLLKTLINIGWIFVVFALIYVGFKFVIASGNPTELAKAKKAFMWTVIGGVILLGSVAISQVICKTAAQFDTSIECKLI